MAARLSEEKCLCCVEAVPEPTPPDALASPPTDADIEALLDEFSSILIDPPPRLPQRAVDHRIDVDPGATPSRLPPRRLGPMRSAEAKQKVTDLLINEKITESLSPYSAPVLFVTKKDGTLRMVMDYRALNKITVKNAYPLPRIDDLLDKLHGATPFSKFYLQQGYNQVRINPDDCHKTAFTTPFGHFEWRVLASGLCNAPATFMHLMNTVLSPFLDDCVILYLDDILVHSKSKEDHLRHLRAVLSTLRDHQLYAKHSKCAFNQSEVEFLGHVVNADGISMDPHKVDAVRNWPVPRTVLDIQRFLGLTGFYRKFIAGYANLALPMTDLLKKDTKFRWGPEQQSSFDALIAAMTSAPLLHIADRNGLVSFAQLASATREKSKAKRGKLVKTISCLSSMHCKDPTAKCCTCTSPKMAAASVSRLDPTLLSSTARPCMGYCSASDLNCL